MSFHLKRRPSLARQLKKILHGELQEARNSLARSSPDKEEVHQARVALKKTRAVLGLLRKALEDQFDRWDDPLREAAHHLAELRDADVTQDTLVLLAGKYPTLMNQRIVREVRRGLESRQRNVRRHTSGSLSRARAALKQADGSLPEAVGRSASRKEIFDGIVLSYRRARRAFTYLTPDAGSPAFHQWRRRLKIHWYQMRLLEDLDAGPRHRAAALNGVEELLGVDHNLALLRELLLASPARYGSAWGVTVVLGCIAQAQHGLRIDALKSGKTVFEARPSEFGRTLKGWWTGAPHDSGR